MAREKGEGLSTQRGRDRYEKERSGGLMRGKREPCKEGKRGKYNEVRMVTQSDPGP
jgi:hypothetical protein